MIQALFDSKLLMFFIMIMGVIVVTLLALFITQNFTILSGIKEQLIPIANQTSLNVNQTQLFLQSTKHEDAARDKQTKIEQTDRSNQTRFLINSTQDLLEKHHNGLVALNQDLKNFIGIQNNTTLKLFQEIREAQQQNNDILQVLLNATNNIDKLQKNLSSSPPPP